jgi:hypothetical protein
LLIAMRRAGYAPRCAVALALTMMLTARSAEAVSFYLAPDVPGRVAVVQTLPWLIFRNTSGAYSLAETLPQFWELDGIHRLDSGAWLVSFEAPETIGATTYDPRDIVTYSAGTFSLYWSGAAAGVPASANVDAVLLDGGDSGTLVVSFDVPMTIAGITYEPADLVKWTALGFSLYFDASAAVPPIPMTTNVNDAALAGGKIILTFDKPTTLAGITYRQGELVAWDGVSFSSYYFDPLWPRGVALGSLAMLSAPGSIQHTLNIDKTVLTPGNIRLLWSASCSTGAEDYGIYQGQLGAWYSHNRIDCHDDGTPLQEEITPSAGNRYYLVVPLHPNDEGDYGFASSGSARPPGGARCRSTQQLQPCP